MSDFHQAGEITTLHKLGNRNVEEIEAEIKDFSLQRPIALILPVAPAELESAALQNILGHLKKIEYLNQITLALGGGVSKEQFRKIKNFFSVLPQEVHFVWNDGPAIQELYKLLENNGLSAGVDGKGRSVWMAYGYVLASNKSKIIALHDCDVVTYDREFLARLCYPIANYNLGFEFCKGYYSRIADNRMHGRVTRLFVTPFLRTLRELLGDLDYLKYMDSFRYPLAGEFSMIADMARKNQIPGNWGLEVGVLAEIRKNSSKEKVCQADLCEAYEHKHQNLSKDNPQKGLKKMCIDIAKTIFVSLENEGEVLKESVFKELSDKYPVITKSYMKKFESDAAVNGLSFNRVGEAEAIDTFTDGIKIAADEFLKGPPVSPIPNWDSVISKIPDLFDRLSASVKEDTKAM